MGISSDNETVPPARTMGSALARLSILAVEAKARLALGPAPFLSRPALLAFIVDPTGLHRSSAIAIVSRHVQVPVHRVDISTIVQGEGAKSNFTQLFLAAERAGVVLYFDQADALFNAPGPSETHPFGRFDADFLIDRLDAFSGVVIAAVYRKELISPALLQRARHVVDFTQPRQPTGVETPVERNE
jgi:SpoVK/Ycf46/Vps4 family AAA+-type ATPase